jgi:CheY-like chemotaxis protein
MTRILVVDDEIETLDMLRAFLELNGYDVVTTLNSTDALFLAELEKPDLVLLDIMMPVMDGFTICKMMRLHPGTKHLPIVFVTAYAALDLDDRCQEAGADLILMKPFAVSTLAAMVKSALALAADAALKQNTMPLRGTGQLRGTAMLRKTALLSPPPTTTHTVASPTPVDPADTSPTPPATTTHPAQVGSGQPPKSLEG